MNKGSIKFFNEAKGFGFITPEGCKEGEKDVFFHFSGMKGKMEITKMDKGRPCEYDMKDGKNGPEACDIVLLKKEKKK